MRTDEILKSAFRYGLAIAIVVGFFWVLGRMTTLEIPAENKELVYLVVGVLLGKFGTIVDYEWGSSKSSSDKTTIIGKKITEQPAGEKAEEKPPEDMSLKP